ncbi:hypothetical protein V4U86_14990 [Mycobacterium sp. AMU20-3851]|uniref:hypothetical protein n=1 Tax=Mycobacterium sp. AMU20-3851 TaxID=3122055 RepID=UPI003753EB75
MRYVRLGSTARLTGWVALVPLAYFAAEWVVAASWRGHYGYRDQLLGPLGMAFCGPVGNWPCSEIYRAMNIALVATGLAVAIVALSLLVQRSAHRGAALLLVAAGLALSVAGAVTQHASYSVNLTATVVFMALGSISALLIAVHPATHMSGERRVVAVLAGATGLIGYFIYASGHDVLGPGGAQRASIYGILIAVIAVGTAGFGTVARDDVRAADTHGLLEVSR